MTTIVLFSKHHLSIHTRTHVCEHFNRKLVFASDRKIASLACSSQIYSRTSLKVNILYLHAINMNLRGSYIIYFRFIGNLFILLHDLLCLLLENRKLHSCSAYILFVIFSSLLCIKKWFIENIFEIKSISILIIWF